MTIPRSRSAALILLARATAGGALIGAVAALSRSMYSLSWQVDGGIALLVATGWIVCAEMLLGGL